MQNGHSEAQTAIDHFHDTLDNLPRDITPEQFAAFLHTAARSYSEYLATQGAANA